MNEDELISAYVDGRLNEAERAAFDARIAQDPALRRRVAVTRLLIREARALPALQPPRNFILPLDAGQKKAAPEPRRSAFSPWVFRLGSLAATALFVLLVTFELFRPAPFASAPAVAPAAAPAAPAAEMLPQRELPAPAPAEPAVEMAPMGVATGTAVLSVTPMQSEALPADQIQAAGAPETGAEPAGADVAQPSSRAMGEPAATVVAPAPAPQPPASGPIIPVRVLAAVALLTAIVLGLLGWVRR
ncbi:MAG: anti-sigma factor [Candidatus Roseilinea sp.]|nr:MAG: anti-sigma factor [Candidatus Roseilinea sp.]